MGGGLMADYSEQRVREFYLVEADVLPEVFQRVVQAKRLLAQGKAPNLSKAAELAGISRSAMYKYKDAVFPYLGASTRQIATFYTSLADEPGVLSAFLAELHRSGANVLTINQNIPVDGVAPVSVSIRTDKMLTEPEALVEALASLYGVVEVKLLEN
jgi:chorismate mutase